MVNFCLLNLNVNAIKKNVEDLTIVIFNTPNKFIVFPNNDNDDGVFPIVTLEI